MNRRDLIGRLLAGGAVAAPEVIAEAVDSLRLDAADRRLSKLLEHTPPQTAVRCLIEVSAEGQASIADFVSALARERNRAARRNAAARRRARHAGNETLYHGPVSLGDNLDGGSLVLITGLALAKMKSLGGDLRSGNGSVLSTRCLISWRSLFMSVRVFTPSKNLVGLILREAGAYFARTSQMQNGPN